MQIPDSIRKFTVRTIEARWFYYLVSAVFVCFLGFEVYVMSKNIWIGDFWTHTPPVIEFAREQGPYHNPWIHSSLPDVYMTPFHWFWGKVMWLTNLEVLDVMLISGCVNLLLVYMTIRAFCSVVLKEKHFLFHAFVMFCVLFYWGYNPWGYSGFFHFGFINFILPYPSTIGFCVVLGGICLHELVLNQKRTIVATVVLVLYNVFAFAFLFLIHPLTFVFYGVAIASLFISQALQRRLKTGLWVISVGVPAIVAGAMVGLYPFFPVREFLQSGGGNFHFANYNMYDDRIFLRLLPALFAAPLVYRLKGEQRSFLKIFFTLLVVLYGYGYVTEQFSYGRSIALVYFCVQLAVAIYLRDAYKAHFRKAESIPTGKAFYLAGVGCMFMINLVALPRTAYNLLTAPALNREALREVDQALPEHRVVVASDEGLLQKINTFLGKGMLPLQPTIWIKDEPLRRAALDSLFRSEDPVGGGALLSRQYGATHILLYNTDTPQLRRFPYPRRFRNDVYTLLELTNSAADDTVRSASN